MINEGDSIDIDPCAGRKYYADITFLDTDGNKIPNQHVENGRRSYAHFRVSNGTMYHQSGTEIGTENLTEKGLTVEWNGVIFVNPPFSEKKQWLRKAVESVEYGHAKRVNFVTPDSTDTKSWWHEYIAEYANLIWFSRGRINYNSPVGHEPEPWHCSETDNVTFGTAVSVFGSEPPRKTLEAMANTGQLVKSVDYDR